MLNNLMRDLLRNKILPGAFKKATREPINPNKVVFANDRDATLPDNMRGLERLFKENGYEISYHLKQKTSSNPIKGKTDKISQYKRFMHDYATAGYVFLTDYYLPAYTCQPRHGTKVVQLWHACGAFKKWGYSSSDKPWGVDADTLEKHPIHNTYTDVFCSSSEIVKWYAQAFNCSSDVIKPLGTPRTDVYFNKDFVKSSRSIVEEQCPGLNGRKILLYAPTFRLHNVDTAHNSINMHISQMYNCLRDEYALVLKLHPFVAQNFVLDDKTINECHSFVYNISNSVDIDRALCSADMLITDYSSVVFEYSLLNRPMIFYAYDKDEYIRDRDFYYPYDDFVPGKIASNTDELIQHIKAADCENVAAFATKFMSACDGNSTQRIFDYLTGGLT